jgi:pimeloyl-ACP methyl ester carboxylesterase
MKNVVVNQFKNYMLIHGAWHGSWCWQQVASKMQSLGYKVSIPDLPGHFRNKYDFKDVTLTKYVNHISDLLRQNDEKVVLVGHSMAGIVISQVAEIMPHKISALVYLSGFVPSNNGCLLDEEKQAKFPSVALEVKINEQDYFISVNPNKIQELFFNNCTKDDVEYALAHFQHQPLLPFLDKVSIAHNFSSVHKLYIECLKDKAIHIEDQRRMHSKIDCEVVSIDTDHSPFFSNIDELVSIIGSV